MNALVEFVNKILKQSRMQVGGEGSAGPTSRRCMSMCGNGETHMLFLVMGSGGLINGLPEIAKLSKF